MRGKGINYDTGFFPGGEDSRPGFDPETARRELRIIAEQLHCTAVRISGGDPQRLETAARYAAEAGLEVWFAPFPCEQSRAELLPFFADCAQRAERIRLDGAEMVLVTGCEMTLFNHGFLDGANCFDRITTLSTGGPALWSRLGEIGGALNGFLNEVVDTVRAHFGGRLSYASGTWEFLDWRPFDYIGVDAYRDANNAGTFRQDLRRYTGQGKPVVVTEFGSCTYTGAADKGGMGWGIVDVTQTPPRLDGVYERNEGEQVRYLTELLEIFEAEGVDSAFWFTFVSGHAVHRPDGDPRDDTDMASYGVVKVLADGARGTAFPELGWEPKEVFHALAAAYGATAAA